MRTNLELVQTELETACVDLLEAYGLQADLVETSDDDIDLAGVIGFTSPRLSGSLTVYATRAFLEDTRSRGRECFDDWVGEMANQLLGRLKARLLAYDLSLALSTPVTISGYELQKRQRMLPNSSRWYCTGSGHFGLSLDLQAAPDLVLERVEDPAGEAVGEGSTLLF